MPLTVNYKQTEAKFPKKMINEKGESDETIDGIVSHPLANTNTNTNTTNTTNTTTTTTTTINDKVQHFTDKCIVVG